uniref:Uncharacterized protein n=1 Tax=Strigamia maritima TaxID=126957 RepID=T1JJL2_STRMM
MARKRQKKRQSSHFERLMAILIDPNVSEDKSPAPVPKKAERKKKKKEMTDQTEDSNTKKTILECLGSQIASPCAHKSDTSDDLSRLLRQLDRIFENKKLNLHRPIPQEDQTEDPVVVPQIIQIGRSTPLLKRGFMLFPGG